MTETLESTPLLKYAIPPIFTQSGVEKMRDEAIIDPETSIPPCTTLYAKSSHGRTFPQAIAHRGYKAAYPENTMGAFAGAVHIGAHAIETDVHLTKDDVVVLSHDATLKRCFGRPEKLLDVEWSLVRTLQTLAEPKQYMPRLMDLLFYLAQPGNEHVWLVLDIKMDNDADAIMRLIASTMASVAPHPKKPWNTRVVLGCWAAKYIPLASEYLPGFPITHIGFSLCYAAQFFKVPNVSFNMLIQILMAPGGKRFIRKCKAAKRPVLAWTVNTEDKMRWCIRNEIDGVLTDDPKLFLEVCDRYDGVGGDREGLSWAVWVEVVKIWLFAIVFGCLYRNRFSLRRRLKG